MRWREVHVRAWFAGLALGVFGGMFGARSIDPSERHEGLVAAVADRHPLAVTASLAIAAYLPLWLMWDVGNVEQSGLHRGKAMDARQQHWPNGAEGNHRPATCGRAASGAPLGKL